MNIRLEMHCAAGKAKKILGDSSEIVARFVHSQLNSDGGFKSRGGQSDLYYSVFGIELLKALDTDIPFDTILNYLDSFDIDNLDLVHLSSLVRCYKDIEDYTGRQFINNRSDVIIRNIQKFRSRDGGFSTETDAQFGNVYGCFLTLGIYQDLKLPLLQSTDLLNSVELSRKQDFSFANEKFLDHGTTPATAAAVVVLKHLRTEVSQQSLDWLLARQHFAGGFCAIAGIEGMNIADLLSTATTLYALSINNISLEEIREKTLDYLDMLWNIQGGFAGNVFDTTLDCEYTYYGLLSLGLLSE